METGEQHILRERAADNLHSLADRMKELSGQVRVDADIDAYFEQVNIQKAEICSNLTLYGDHLEQIRSRLKDKRCNPHVVGELIAHLMVWLSQNTIYGAETSSIKRATLLLQIDCKLQCFMQFSQSAIYFKEDITSVPLFSAQYEPVYKHIKFIGCEDPVQTRQQYNRVRSLMTITNAAVLTELAQSNCVLGVAAFGISFPRFLIDFSEAELRCHAFFRKPKLSELQEIWNLPQKGAISKLKYLQFQGIGTNQQLYVPTLQSPYASPLTPSPQAIKIRILSSSKISFWEESQIQPVGCSCWWTEPEQVQNNIILHAHGGGFIALSSSTMQSYTRRWANTLGVVVISIDYSKPPQHTFPKPVHDMLAVYRFVTQQLHKHCKIKPKNIILAGDSAGGNLMCSLMGLIIKYNLLMPKGMFLAYPAVDLRKIYSPSRLHSFTDAILQPSLLLLCLKQYLGINQDAKQNDPLASPLLLSEQFVSEKKGDYRFPVRWPTTQIVIGELDPLLDDTLRFCQRLKQSNIDYQCRIYKQLGHGFLSVEKMISQAEQGILDSITILRQLLQKANN